MQAQPRIPLTLASDQSIPSIDDFLMLFAQIGRPVEELPHRKLLVDFDLMVKSPLTIKKRKMGSSNEPKTNQGFPKSAHK